MSQLLNATAKYWSLILAFLLVITTASNVLETQKLHAQKIDKLEMIRDDILDIKIKLERIDERVNLLRGKEK